MWGKIVPAAHSLKIKAVPIGLASGIEVCNPIPRDGIVTWDDVRVHDCTNAHKLRKQMEMDFPNSPEDCYSIRLNTAHCAGCGALGSSTSITIRSPVLI